MPASNTYNELKQVHMRSERVERQLHRIWRITPLHAEEYHATRQRLLVLRELGSSLAIDDQTRSQAVATFTAIAEELLAPLRKAEALVDGKMRLHALQLWAAVRVARRQERGALSPRMAYTAHALTTRFSQLFGFANSSGYLNAEERARIVEELLASYHDALFTLLGEEALMLPPTHKGGTPPCSVSGCHPPH